MSDSPYDLGAVGLRMQMQAARRKLQDSTPADDYEVKCLQSKLKSVQERLDALEARLAKLEEKNHDDT